MGLLTLYVLHLYVYTWSSLSELMHNWRTLLIPSFFTLFASPLSLPPIDFESEANFQLKKLLEKYRHQRRIKHKSLKCLFTGPPRVGKTTLKKRLLKTIKNLISSGVVNPSGGLEKPITVVIGETRGRVTVTMESDTDWQPQHNLLDEAQVVLEFIDQQHS